MTLQIEVEKTGHIVRSYWEKEIDLLLHHFGVEYGYESERFNLGDRYYTPDFIVGDVVIEVKGYSREYDYERARRFLDRNAGKTYVVIGDSLPCDVHIQWTEREAVLDVVRI